MALIKLIRCKRGYVTLETVLIMAVVLLSVLYFTVQLGLALYNAGVEVGMNLYDVSVFYRIDAVNKNHVYFSKNAKETDLIIGGMRLYDVERQLLHHRFSNHMTVSQPHWQGIANQCTIKVYKSLMEKPK